MDEIVEKTERLARLAHTAGVGGILLNTQPNFAWLTGGRSNRIDGSRENGSGSLFVSARGERYVIANNIEMPRLHDEALAGFDFRPIEYRWTQEQADPAMPIRCAKDVLGNGASVGCDNALPGGTAIEAQIAAQRNLLTDVEVQRYRSLGIDLGRVMGDVCRALVPGLTEMQIAARAQAAAASVGARAVVSLVAADNRIARFRHPVPTDIPWHHTVLVVMCAQRDGLVVALSRIVTAGAPVDGLQARTAATGVVFERLLNATQAGATGAELFATAARAYAEIGFPGQEAMHHQGGAIGYRAREWIAHPTSQEIVQSQQAFAWNPSITGTKIEDTALIHDDTVELLTTTPDWPAIPVKVRGEVLSAAGILAI